MEFQDEFAGAVEYYVALWFRWSAVPRKQWEVVYSLTYNEPDKRQNHVGAGDRVLSVFQYQDHRIFFSTYTTPNDHDGFQQIFSECPTPAPDQMSWVYAYFGYSRKLATSFAYYKTKSTTTERKLATMHRVPKYLGFYLGRDGYHTPYNGKFAYVYIGAGQGAFRVADFDQEPSYAAGIVGLLPKPLEWDARAKEMLPVSNAGDPVV